ncbi:hypothetical protein U1Q18_034452, partial [Sarracenia purpurea var. burkii]
FVAPTSSKAYKAAVHPSSSHAEVKSRWHPKRRGILQKDLFCIGLEKITMVFY